MGLFSKLFGSSSEREQELCDQYAAMFQASGMPQSEARDAVRDMMQRANEVVREAGTTPANFGDTLLEKEASDEHIRSMLRVKREEGVRDADIRWWWNMPSIERAMLGQADDIFRVAFFLRVREEKNLSEGEAVKLVNKRFPNYGDAEDTSQLTGEDRPLPWELKDRINRYIEKRSQTDPDEYTREVENASTLNALIRREIAGGRL